MGRQGFTGVQRGVLGLAVVLSSCVDDDVTAPSQGRRVSDRAHTTHLPGGTVTLAVPSNSAAPQMGGVSWQSTGLKVRRGVNVRFRMPETMRGLLNEPPDPPLQCAPPQIPMNNVSYTDIPPGGFPELPNWWMGMVQAAITGSTSSAPGSSSMLYGGPHSRLGSGGWAGVTYLDQAAPDSGVLWLQRREVDGQCEGYVKYSFGGSQVITIDFPEILVTRDTLDERDYLREGDSTRFIATASGFSPSANAWFWEWRPDSGSPVQIPQCLGATSCTYVPPRKGRMRVGATDPDNLLYKGESDVLDVMRCVVDGTRELDSLANHPLVRQALLAALDGSGVGDSTHLRKERIGFIYRDTTLDTSQSPPRRRSLARRTAVQAWLGPLEAGVTPCDGKLSQSPGGTEGFKLVAYYHTHPFSGQTSASGAEIMPASCGPDRAGYQYRAFPSQQDSTSASSLRAPGLVIDREELDLFEQDRPRANHQLHPWNNAQCRW